MQRYRITRTERADAEQTWVLLPDQESAVMQARELSQREKGTHVRVFHEIVGQTRELILDLPPRPGR